MQNKLESQMAHLNDIFKPLAEVCARIQNGINEFLSNNADFFKNFRTAIERLPDRLKEHWADVAQYGWFMNWETTISITAELSKGQAELDAIMMHHIEENWDVLTKKILELCPDRSHILRAAFRLHAEGNYIASIPLFMAQTDGVCAQYLGAFLFSEHEKRTETINRTVDDSGDVFLAAFLNVLNTDTQFRAGISAASNNKKQLAPNRNGVLHGSRKHLDYGSRINSFKTFSLLAFVVMVLADKDFQWSKKL